MHIARLHVHHFGILRHCLAEDLAPGLVIIEGPNRSGKTSLMRVLRCLPFGFGGRDLPEPARLLQAEADVVHNADRFHVALRGKAAARITRLSDGAALDPDDWWGVDQFTYWQVFTVSLDELRAEPIGLKRGELRQLQTVLLGHGWMEAVRLPEAAGKLADVAEAIGGQNCRAREIKAAVEAIEKAMSDQEQAAKRVPEHRALGGQREELARQLEGLAAQVAEAQRSVRRLELVGTHFADSLRLSALRRELAAVPDADRLAAFPEHGLEDLPRPRQEMEQWRQRVEEARLELLAARGAGHRANLLALAEPIDRLHAQASGWRSELQRLREDRLRLDQEREAIRQEARRLFPGLAADDLSFVDRLRVNLISRDQLAMAVERLTAAQEALADLDRQIAAHTARQEELAEQLRSLAATEPAPAPASLRQRRERLDQWLQHEQERQRHVAAIAAGQQLRQVLCSAPGRAPTPLAAAGVGLAVALGLGLAVGLAGTGQWLPAVVAGAAGLGLALYAARQLRHRRAAWARFQEQLAAVDRDLADHQAAAQQALLQQQRLAEAAGLGADVSAAEVREQCQHLETLRRRAEEVSAAWGKRQQLEEQMARLEEARAKLEAERPARVRAVDEGLEAFRRLLGSLGLPETVQPKTALEFAAEAERLVGRVEQFRAQEQALGEAMAALNPVLTQAAATLGRAGFAVDVPSSGWVGGPSSLLERISQAKAALDEALVVQNRVDRATERLEEVKRQADVKRQELLDLLNRGLPEAADRIAEADDLEPWLEAFVAKGKKRVEFMERQQEAAALRSRLLTALSAPAAVEALGARADEPEALLASLEAAAAPFATAAEAQAAFQASQTQLERLRQAEREGRDRLVRLEAQIAALAADDALREAQQRIALHRDRLACLARRYAVHRLAAVLVTEVHRRCVAQAHGPILQAATATFHRLTAGAYQEIRAVADGDTPGFLVTTAGAEQTQSPDILSRATEEQLFLAVRLSRIRSIPTPLPVVIDDSLVNFDPAHRHNALELIRELVATHQVFLMTCHPEMADLALQLVPGAQRWGLDQGRLSRLS